MSPQVLQAIYLSYGVTQLQFTTSLWRFHHNYPVTLCNTTINSQHAAHAVWSLGNPRIPNCQIAVFHITDTITILTKSEVLSSCSFLSTGRLFGNGLLLGLKSNFFLYETNSRSGVIYLPYWVAAVCRQAFRVQPIDQPPYRGWFTILTCQVADGL